MNELVAMVTKNFERSEPLPRRYKFACIGLYYSGRQSQQSFLLLSPSTH
jgi:hypothetical protein